MRSARSSQSILGSSSVDSERTAVFHPAERLRLGAAQNSGWLVMAGSVLEDDDQQGLRIVSST